MTQEQWDRWQNAKMNHERRRMGFELLCEFFDRALAEDNLDKAVTIYKILDPKQTILEANL